MTLSDLSIKNPVFAWMLMFALMIFGWIGYSRMGVSQMPDVDFPIVNIAVTWEGAAPEIMETEVVDIIEDAVTSVQGVKEITSSSKLGNATITIEFELDRGIDVALQEVQTKIAQAQQRLPKDMDPAIVTKVNPEDNPIMWLALSGDVPVKDLMVYAQDHLKNRFQTVPGVGEVLLGGLVPRNLRVWLDADKMRAQQITVEDILAAIKREHAELPAGQIETDVKEFNVRTLGEISDPAEFGNLLITQRGGQQIHIPIALREVARIEDGLADVRRISRVGLKRAVGLGIRKQRGANAVEIATRIKAKMAETIPTLPKGMQLGIRFDSTKFIKDSVRNLTHHLLLAAVLTSLVCWLFLGSWSSTLNVLLAIPTAVLGTFIVTYFLGFTLNSFTLLGLTLSIGIIVDDAIMVLENIVRHRELGQDKLTGAVFGAREITFAAMAATIAVLAIFLPVVFMKGIIGKFFFQFGVTISAAVSFSLLEALTLAPMRCSQFLEVGGHGSWLIRNVDAAFAWCAAAYRRRLEWTLAHRWTVVGFGALFFAASLISVKKIRKEFVPAQDQGMFLIRMETPVGSSFEYTDAKFKEAEKWMTENPAVEGYYSAVGGFQGGEVNSGMLFVTLKDLENRPKKADSGKIFTQGDVMADTRKSLNAIPTLRALIIDLSQGGFSASRGFPIEFTIRGPDWDTLIKTATDFKKTLEKTGELLDVDTDYKSGMPEVRIYPDRAKAYARGVSISSIGTTINAMIGGVRAGLFTDNGRRYDVRVRTEAKYRLAPEDINKFYVRNIRGEMIRLSEVVKLETKPSLLAITRKDRERAIGIYANVVPGKSQAQILADIEKLGKETLPEGYHVVFSGSSKTFKESFQSLLLALVLGILVAYMVLGAQFNSFIHPVTVLLALPFSLSGAFLTLWMFDRSLNINSMIGLLLLMGLVKKNSILLVDFTNQRREEGLEPHAALLDACPVRLRPILMTSIATIAAAIPTALSRGAGSEATVPMALSLIGGVSVSTLLTLFVVPAAYSLFVRIESGKSATTSAAVIRAVRAAERAEDERVNAGH